MAVAAVAVFVFALPSAQTRSPTSVSIGASATEGGALGRSDGTGPPALIDSDQRAGDPADAAAGPAVRETTIASVGDQTAGPATTAGRRVQAVTGAGVGTAEALAAPDCDRSTGRIMVPHKLAPPCVIPWPKGADNGGATAQGVTATSIKVVVYHDLGNDPESFRQGYKDFSAIYEHSYRTWGRRIDWVFYEPSGTDEVAQRADAIQIASLKPFAVDNRFGNEVFKTELAGRGVLLVNGSNVDRIEQADAQSPYRWSMYPSPELFMANVAQYVASLAGRPARWAGDVVYHTQPRKFGVIYPGTWDGEFFGRYLSALGVRTQLMALPYRYNGSSLGDPVSAQEQAPVLIAKMKDAAVNNLVVFTDLFMTASLTNQASQQRYRPEWTITGMTGQDFNLFARTFDQSQWDHAAGLGPSIPVQARSGPNYLSDIDWLWKWYWGPDKQQRGNNTSWPRQPILYTGIHLAGPSLTPETFRDALFAYPPSGGPMCGCVAWKMWAFGKNTGVPWNDYSAWDDFNLIWWSSRAMEKGVLDPGPTPGNYYYLDGGKKFAAGHYPKQEPPMFDPGRAVLALNEYPTQDRVPDYPCRGCPSAK